eukprot:8812687-Pyramimonas_sp.AAC.1
MLRDPAVADMMRQVSAGQRRSGVDVVREGPPSENVWEAPVPRADGVVPLPSMLPSESSRSFGGAGRGDLRQGARGNRA